MPLNNLNCFRRNSDSSDSQSMEKYVVKNPKLQMTTRNNRDSLDNYSRGSNISSIIDAEQRRQMFRQARNSTQLPGYTPSPMPRMLVPKVPPRKNIFDTFDETNRNVKHTHYDMPKVNRIRLGGRKFSNLSLLDVNPIKRTYDDNVEIHDIKILRGSNQSFLHVNDLQRSEMKRKLYEKYKEYDVTETDCELALLGKQYKESEADKLLKCEILMKKISVSLDIAKDRLKRTNYDLKRAEESYKVEVNEKNDENTNG